MGLVSILSADIYLAPGPGGAPNLGPHPLSLLSLLWQLPPLAPEGPSEDLTLGFPISWSWLILSPSLGSVLPWSILWDLTVRPAHWTLMGRSGWGESVSEPWEPLPDQASTWPDSLPQALPDVVQLSVGPCPSSRGEFRSEQTAMVTNSQISLVSRSEGHSYTQHSSHSTWLRVPHSPIHSWRQVREKTESAGLRPWLGHSDLLCPPVRMGRACLPAAEFGLSHEAYCGHGHVS